MLELFKKVSAIQFFCHSAYSLIVSYYNDLETAKIKDVIAGEGEGDCVTF